MNTARTGGAGAGSQTAGVSMGGNSPPATAMTTTELWNGTSWTTNPTGLSTARGYTAGSGTQALGLVTGGSNPPATPTAATEEWTGPYSTLNYKTLTTS
jgi:hypothetical protein